MARVLVTDGEQRAALAVVRSLGRAGHEVQVVSSRGRGLAGWSRWVEGWSRVPSPLDEPEAFVGGVRKQVREWESELVLPITEPALYALLPCRETLRPARTPFPDLEAFRRATAKDVTAEHASAAGFRVPRQIVLARPNQALPDERELTFPVVIKASRTISNGDGIPVKTGTSYADDSHQLAATVRRFPDSTFPLLLQERVVGPGVGIFLLLWGNEVRARFAHRRIREKPPSGGVSVLRESVEVPEEWFRRAEELLRRIGWSGVAMVELKVDEASGEPVFMEVNPRFWGSLQLAVDAGVDFPALMVALALAENPPSQLNYREGVRTRWFWGDVDHLLARVRRSPAELNLPLDSPGMASAGAEFLRSFGPRVNNEVLRWSDPMPALVETVNWFRGR